MVCLFHTVTQTVDTQDYEISVHRRRKKQKRKENHRRTHQESGHSFSFLGFSLFS